MTLSMEAQGTAHDVSFGWTMRERLRETRLMVRGLPGTGCSESSRPMSLCPYQDFLLARDLSKPATTSVEQESLRSNLMHLDAMWRMCLRQGWVHAESDRLPRHPVANSSTYHAGV